MTALRLAKEQGATIVIVAHRPSILAHANKILVVDPGGCRLIDRAAREREKARLKVVQSGSDAAAESETQPVEAQPPAATAPAPRARRQPAKRVAKGK